MMNVDRNLEIEIVLFKIMILWRAKSKFAKNERRRGDEKGGEGKPYLSLSRRRLMGGEKLEEHWKILRNLGDRRYTSLIYYIIILHNPKLSATKI